jgi:DNA-binding transcriptional ArsR family regulator
MMTHMTKNKPLPEASFERIAPVLRVLGHPDRLRIVELLMREAVTVAELAERLGLAQNAVSQHLSGMAAHEIVARKREGRCVYYSVVHPAARSLMQCMYRNTKP